MRDVADPVAGAGLVDARGEGLLAHLEQALRLRADLADREGVGAVRNEPVERDPDVDGDQVPLLDPVVAGNPVHDHRVRRDARRRRKAAVALRRRDSAVLADEVLGDPVELGGRDPGLSVLAEQVDRLGDELAGASHSLDFLEALPDDQAGTCSSAAWMSVKTSFSVRFPRTGTRLPRVR